MSILAPKRFAGAKLVRQILDFYSLFVSIAEGYSERARKTVQLPVKDPYVTEIRVVTAPQKALRDARFFTDALNTRHFRVSRLYVNRVWEVEPGPEPPDPLAHRRRWIGTGPCRARIRRHWRK